MGEPNVDRSFEVREVSLDMSSSMGERTHTSTLSTDRSLDTHHTTCGTSRLILGRIPMSAESVGKPSLRVVP